VALRVRPDAWLAQQSLDAQRRDSDQTLSTEVGRDARFRAAGPWPPVTFDTSRRVRSIESTAAKRDSSCDSAWKATAGQASTAETLSKYGLEAGSSRAVPDFIDHASDDVRARSN
jgi:hypothetical protein